MNKLILRDGRQTLEIGDSIKRILTGLDERGSLGLNLSPGDDVCRDAAALIRRLLAGDFTAEEIHNFCHKLPETVSATEFASGCMAYQTQLYGCSPVMALLRATDELLDEWGISVNHPINTGSRLRRLIREQIL